MTYNELELTARLDYLYNKDSTIRTVHEVRELRRAQNEFNSLTRINKVFN